MKAEEKPNITTKAGEGSEWKIAIEYLKLRRGTRGVKYSKISTTEESIKLCNFAIYTLIETESTLDLLLTTSNFALLRK